MWLAHVTCICEDFVSVGSDFVACVLFFLIALRVLHCNHFPTLPHPTPFTLLTFTQAAALAATKALTFSGLARKQALVESLSGGPRIVTMGATFFRARV